MFFLPKPTEEKIFGVKKEYLPLLFLRNVEYANFLDGANTDTSGMYVLSITPTDGVGNVLVTESVTITFNEPVDPTTIDLNSIQVTTGGVAVNGSFTIEDAKVIFKPSLNLNYNTVYTVLVTTSVKDVTGNPFLNNSNFTFTTSAFPDTTSPDVISTNPTANSLNIDINQIIQVIFSESIDLSTITASSVLVNDGSTNLSLSYNLVGSVLSITANPSLSSLKVHRLTLTSGIKDLSGNSLLFDYSIQFQTNDTIGPKVVSTIPIAGAIRFVPGNPIQITFDEELDFLTVNSSSVLLSQNLTPISGTISLSGNTISFLPTTTLAFNTNYTMTLTTAIQDISGNPMSLNYVFSFTTYNPNIEIFMGAVNTCFLLPTGSLRCVGYGSFGNLGYGDFAHKFDALITPDLFFGEGVKVIQGSLGPTHSCAVFSNGRGKCWGDNALGKLGYSASVNVLNNVLNILDYGISPKITSISTGSFFTCVLLETKKVRCFGDNFYGQLGYSHRDNIFQIENAPDLNLGEDVVELDTGNNHTCVRFVSGNVRCWGGNVAGQIGNGDNTRVVDASITPNVNFIDTGLVAEKISLGGNHTCVLFTNKKVKCWGSGANGYPPPYDNGLNQIFSPRSDFLFFPEDVTQIATGDAHSCVILLSGKIKCWGDGSGTSNYGVGYGNGVAVKLASSAADIDFGIPAVKIFAGSTHTCAVLSNGAIKCWGTNEYGQLGYNSSILDITTATNAGDIYFNE